MKKVLFTSHVANFVKFNQPFMDLLKEKGYEVHYASMGEEPVDCDAHFTVPFERSPFKLNNLKAIWQLKKIIDREKYDLIHTHTPMGSVVTRIAAMRARKKDKTRVIYTAHGFHFFKGASPLHWLTFYPVEKWLAKHMDILITINQEDFELAKRKFKTDVRYIAGVGVDPKKFSFSVAKAEKNKLRQSLGLRKDDFVMIYPAELSKRKNQLWLIRSLAGNIKANPKIHLLLPGKDSLDGECQALVRNLGIKKNVHFLGYRRDMPQLMKASDVAVSAALQEGLPVNLLEAMCAGLPIVATDCRGNRDLLLDGSNGFLVAQGDAAKFTHAVMELFADKTLRRSMGNAGKKRVKSYLIDAILPEVANVYEKKTRILHLLNSSKFSGAENVVCEIVKNTNDEFETLYCSPPGSINQALADRSIRHVAVKRLSYLEVRRIMKEYEPDVIHAHDFRASIVASLFSKKAKVVSHIHQNPDWLHSRNVKPLLYKLRLAKFDNVIVVTDAVARSFVFDGEPAGKVVTVHNYIDKKAITEKAKKPHVGKYDIVFCGRLEAVKQPLDFVAAIASIRAYDPTVKAVMVGDGSMKDECAALIARHGLEDNIEMVGFQPNPYGYIKNSTFLLLTSQAEGFGLVAAEALVLGTLVVAYDIPSISEIMGGRPDIIAASPADMAKKYKRLAVSDALYKKQLSVSQKKAAMLLQDKKRWQEKITSVYKA